MSGVDFGRPAGQVSPSVARKTVKVVLRG